MGIADGSGASGDGGNNAVRTRRRSRKLDGAQVDDRFVGGVGSAGRGAGVGGMSSGTASKGSGGASGKQSREAVHHHPPKEMAAEVGYPVRGGQTLLIAYFPWEASEEDIETEFAKFCRVKRVHLVVDKSSKKPRCFGFVKFMSKADAEDALRATTQGLVQLPDTRGHVWHLKAEWTKSGDMVVDDSETEQEVAKRKEERRNRVEQRRTSDTPAGAAAKTAAAASAQAARGGRLPTVPLKGALHPGVPKPLPPLQPRAAGMPGQLGLQGQLPLYHGQGLPHAAGAPQPPLYGNYHGSVQQQGLSIYGGPQQAPPSAYPGAPLPGQPVYGLPRDAAAAGQQASSQAFGGLAHDALGQHGAYPPAHQGYAQQSYHAAQAYADASSPYVPSQHPFAPNQQPGAHPAQAFDAGASAQANYAAQHQANYPPPYGSQPPAPRYGTPQSHPPGYASQAYAQPTSYPPSAAQPFAQGPTAGVPPPAPSGGQPGGLQQGPYGYLQQANTQHLQSNVQVTAYGSYSGGAAGAALLPGDVSSQDSSVAIATVQHSALMMPNQSLQQSYSQQNASARVGAGTGPCAAAAPNTAVSAAPLRNDAAVVAAAAVAQPQAAPAGSDQQYLDMVWQLPQMSLHDKVGPTIQQLPAPPAQQPPAPPASHAGANRAHAGHRQAEAFHEVPGGSTGHATVEWPAAGHAAVGPSSMWNFDDAAAKGMVDGLVGGEDGASPAPLWSAHPA